MKEKFKEIYKIMEQELSCSAHKIDHVMRVYNNCKLIAKDIENVDMDVLLVSALLHDIARVKESRDKSGNIDHAILGGEMAAEILVNLNYERDFILKVKSCIQSHRFRSGKIPESIEGKILFDADKLDVIGAVGIARTFMIAGQYGQSILCNETRDDNHMENTSENGRLKDVSKHSPFMEYEFKFSKIPSKLYTEKGKEMGVQRLKIMKKYFEDLKREINICN